MVLHREGKGVLGQARQVLMKSLFLLFSSSLSLLCSYEKINHGGFSFFNFLFFGWWFISLIFFFCLSHWMFLKLYSFGLDLIPSVLFFIVRWYLLCSLMFLEVLYGGMCGFFFLLNIDLILLLNTLWGGWMMK